MPDEAGIAHAAQILRRGGLVAVPTETVYGLAARADDPDAVARVYEAKGRPGFNPLIAHVRDAEQARRYVEFDERASELAERFWPGPLTMVLPLKRNADLAPAVTAGLPTLAVRVPAHSVMRAVLHLLDCPLAAPSANRSETVSPTSAEHVLSTLDGRIDALIDGGSCERGLESTIVVLRQTGGWELLRPGPIGREALEEILGAGDSDDRGAIEAPGQLARHYAPGKPMRLEAVRQEPDEFLIGFGPIAGDVSLSPAGNLDEAAARLYDRLHEAARSDRPRIAVAPIPDAGLGIAINDRLRRAATEES